MHVVKSRHNKIALYQEKMHRSYSRIGTAPLFYNISTRTGVTSREFRGYRVKRLAPVPVDIFNTCSVLVKTLTHCGVLQKI